MRPSSAHLNMRCMRGLKKVVRRLTACRKGAVRLVTGSESSTALISFAFLAHFQCCMWSLGRSKGEGWHVSVERTR